MAKKIIVQLVDDLDGSAAAETVTFALDGVSFEIDLSEENAAALRADLAKWVSSATRTGGRRSARSSASRSAAGSSEAARVRAWARAQGIEVSERGRVPAELKERYARESGS